MSVYKNKKKQKKQKKQKKNSKERLYFYLLKICTVYTPTDL